MANVSGTVYTDAGSTTMGSGRTINISINGAASAGSTTTAAGGTYTIAGLTISAGDVLTVYIQDGVNPEKAVTVTRGTGSNMTGVDLYQDYLSVRSDDGSSVTPTQLNTADNNGATGISAIYSSTANTGATTASGKGFCIQSGQTFAPSGIFSLTVRGNWLNRGTYTPGTGQSVTFGGTSSHTVTSGGSAFNSVVVNGAGGTYTLTDALVLSVGTGSLTLTAGTLDVSASNFPITLVGSWTNQGGTFVPRSGTVTLNGSGSQNIQGTSGTTFYDLAVTGGGRTVTFAAGQTQTATHSLVMTGSAGSLLTLQGSANGDWTIAVPATFTLSYLSVSHSTATGNTAVASNSTDGGSNVNWSFGASAAAGRGRWRRMFRR